MNTNLYRAFTGSEIEVILLKSELEANGISVMVKDDFTSGLAAGFYAGSPSTLDLFINEEDGEKALPIIEEFRRGLSQT